MNSASLDERIEMVVRTVRHNTWGDKPTIDADHLAVLLIGNSKRMSRAVLEETLDAAVDHEQLVKRSDGYAIPSE